MNYLPFLLILVMNCSFGQATHSARKTTKHTPVFKQGICGTVIEKRGNFMPGPDRPTPKGKPVEREVLIYPLLNQSQVDAGADGFINSVREAKPVVSVRSKADGTFCVNLPPGRYSVIVREPNGLYANQSDTQNNIFPVTVEKGKRTQITVNITHQAAF